jgi:hypothetical protein
MSGLWHKIIFFILVENKKIEIICYIEKKASSIPLLTV